MAKNDQNKDTAKGNALFQEGKQLREEMLATEQRILDILTRINKLSSDEVKNAEELSSLITEGAAAEKELAEMQEKSLKLSEKSVKLSKDGVNQLQDQRDLQEEMMDSYWNELLDKQENQKKLQGKLNDLQSRFSQEVAASSDSMSLLNDNAQKVLEITNYTDISNKKVQVAYSRSNELLQEQGDLSQAFLGYLQTQEWTVSEMSDLQADVVKQVDAAAKGEYDIVDLTRAKLDLKREERALQAKQNQMSGEEYSLAQDILQSKKDTLAGIEAQQDAYKKVSEEAEKSLGVFDKITSGDFKGALLQQFKLDTINKQIKEKVGGAFVNVIKEVKAGNLAGAFSAAGKGLKDMISMGPKLLAALGIGAIMMLGNFLIDTFMEADKEVSQLGKDFGISKHEAIGLHEAAAEVSNEMKITGIHAEEVAKGLKTASDNLGGLDLTGAFTSGNAAVQQMVKDTTLLTEKFGLSAEEAGSMNNIAAITGKSVGEMSMMATTLGKGMFSAKESMKILAGIPKSIVSQMAKMPEAMIKTAMHAKALGMNMKQIADIGRKSLDIEQSLEAEMEARAIIGKDINLDGMRAAALAGDQEGVMNELLGQVGSMKEFNDMNVLQKEALAKAAGMEVDQLAEMLGKQEELNNAGLTQEKIKELQGKNAQELLALQKDSGTAEGKAYNEYLKKLAAEKESASLQESMASLMKRLQQLAVKLVGPILDLVDGLMKGQDGAAGLDAIFDAISGVVSMIVPGIKLLASIIGGLIKPLTWIMGAFSSTKETTEGVANGVGQTGDKVKPLISGFGSLLGIVTAIGGFFAGKALLGKGMDMLKDKAADLGKTMMSKVGGPLGKIGGKLLGGGKKEEAGGALTGGGDKAAVGEATKGKNMISGILDKVKEIIDSIKGVVQSAIGFVRDVGKDLLATLNDLIKGIGEILKTGADIIVSVGTKLAEGAMKILNIIMDGLSKAAGKLPDIMGALGKAVVAFFEPMASLVNPAIILGIIIFTGAMIGLGYAFKLLGEGIGAAAPGIKAFFEGVGGVIEKVGEAIAKVIETVTTSVLRLQNIDGAKMLLAAYGITAIAASLAAFGGGSAIAGLGGALGKLFDEDPVDKFNRFAKIDAKGLDAVAKAILTLGQAMQTFSNVSGGLNLDKVDQMIEKIDKLKAAQTSSAISGLATTAIGGLTSFVGNLFGGGGGSTEQQKTQSVATGAPAGAGGAGAAGGKGGDKLDQVIGLLTQILGTTNQPTIIKFGDKTVEEIKSQLNFKKAYNIATDNTYGRSI